jgi:NAD(P)-dependent dehydrogenase (short-subunit alcohol dehydrogenase family)
MSEGVNERVALVTGGGTGIGRAIATGLVADGFRVAVAARRPGPLAEVSAAVGARPYQCDIAQPDQIDQTVSGVLRDFGRLDAVVNCAGIVRHKPVEEATVEDIDALLTTNLRGMILMSQRCIGPLRETKGAIVNISSSLAQLPQPGTGVYAATKGGMEAFSRVLALELAGDGVRVNVVSPAIIRTEILVNAGLDEEGNRRYLETRTREYPLGRLGEPEDVAALVRFLLSPGAVWMTGLTILVDGGRLLGTALASRG